MSLVVTADKIYRKIKSIKKNLFMDENTRAFIEHNKSKWAEYKQQDPQGVILMYYCDIPMILLSDSYFTNILAKKYSAKIVPFSSTAKGFPLNLYYWKRNRVYASFNAQGLIRTVLNEQQRQRQQALVSSVMGQLKTKEDLFELVIDGVWLGVDIYETYLRVCRKPTVDLQDPGLLNMVKQAIGILIYWQDYVATHQVKAIVVSHDAYIYENILCKICYLNKIPVYLPNIIGGCYAVRPYTINDPLFKNYPAMFKRLTPQEQQQGIAIAKQRLQRRLGGEVGVDMPYSTKSAFKREASAQRVLRESEKIKILICSHCFYDNPQAYGRILFPDFYEWLCFLGRMSEKTDYDWYIKMHPDPLPGTQEIIQGIINQFPKITLIPSSTSHLQLIDEGLNFIFTVYGSVGHELAALGVQVVNAGYNPHYGFDFNWHPKTLEEYTQMILNLPNMKKVINKDDIYAFYYMHYFYTIADDLFLTSYRQYVSETPQSLDAHASGYAYFLKDLTAQKHEKICRNLLDFIESGKNYYFSRGPE